MSCNVEELKSFVREFLQKYIKKAEEKEKIDVKIFNEKIFSSLQHYSINERYSIIKEITSIKEHRDIFEKIKLCLTKSSFPNNNWKDNILGVEKKNVLDIHNYFLSYNNSLEYPIFFDNRFSLFKEKDTFAIIGSTFATNKSYRLDSKGHHILDSIYSSICFRSNKFNGYALALGDGAGGHFGEEKQDATIARASHFATKASVRLLSAYLDPDLLAKDLLDVVNLVAEEISQKAFFEGSTLVACRLFLQEDNFRLIGFNIGDSLLLGFNPINKTTYNLLPSNVTEAGTAIIPTAYKSFEIHTIDCILPFDTILFLLSDGVHDELKYEEEKKIYPNKLEYKTHKILSLESLLKEIPINAPVEAYVKKIVDSAITSINQKRLKALESKDQIQIGDDVAILGKKLSILEGESLCNLM